MRLKPKKNELGYWGYVDEYNEWIIFPFFEKVGYFHGKYAKGIKDGEPVFIDREGRWYYEIPWYDREEEIESDNSSKSPLDIFMDGCSRINKTLFKGLRDCD